MIQLHARDIIAVIVILGAFTLKFYGVDSSVNAVLVTVVAFYFGHGILQRKIDRSGG